MPIGIQLSNLLQRARAAIMSLTLMLGSFTLPTLSFFFDAQVVPLPAHSNAFPSSHPFLRRDLSNKHRYNQAPLPDAMPKF